MNIIQHPDIPTPKGHYSPIMEHQGMLYVSGQLPTHPDGSIPEGLEAQLLLALEKVEQLLLCAGSDRHHILQARIYIPDVADWPEVNRIYAGFFGEHKPARCVVPSRELHHGALVEVEAIACIKE